MVQAQERVRTHALGGITRGLLKEVRLALDFEGFPLVWRRYHIPGRGKIKNKVVVSRSKWSALSEEPILLSSGNAVWDAECKKIRQEPQVPKSGSQELMERGFMSIRKI